MDILIERSAKDEKERDAISDRVTVLETSAHTQKTVIALVASFIGIVMTFAVDVIKAKLFS
ncbi:hypothetical protein HYPP_02636 [Hyphomicrobium sp. ghe19]|nr:hypothetical protein HYPP_02636 [Hyphomicrobium sp. ghe19]